MYIQPNSIIQLLKGVPLDNTYTDTLYFGSVSAQQAHFQSYTKKTFTQQSYQRVNKGTLRVQVKADDIYDYNYLIFQNASYGSKWFYAFINKVNYINDSTSEIEYELDVMQTWLFDYILEPSFVVREHSQTDVIGEHIAVEPVETGTPITTEITDKNLFGDYAVVVCRAEGGSS